MAKRQLGLIKPDSVDQTRLGGISKKSDSPMNIDAGDTALEKADEVSE